MFTTHKPLDFINMLDREFDGLLSKLADSNRGGFCPAMDVIESADGYLITLDAPGLSSDSFELECQDGVLTIAGERGATEAEEGFAWLRREVRSGSFRRTVKLAEDADVAGVDAEYRDGVLRITIPRHEAAKPTRIAVRKATA